MATPDWISDVRFFATERTGERGPIGRGSFTVADAIYIQFALFEFDGNTKVVLPSRPNPNFDKTREASKENRKFYEEVGCANREAREDLTRFLVEKLLEERDATTGTETEVPF